MRRTMKGPHRSGPYFSSCLIKSLTLNKDWMCFSRGLRPCILEKPLAALVTAALEPDSQNSFVANRLMDVGDNKLLRVMKTPSF